MGPGTSTRWSSRTTLSIPRSSLREGTSCWRRVPGRLDVMQWVPGIDADRAYDVLAPDAIAVPFRGVVVRICSLAHLRQMKEAAGRPQDLVDLENLPGA